LGSTLFSGLTVNVAVATTSTNPGLTLTLTPGVWICSYAVRIVASALSPVVTAFSAYMSIGSTTNTGINGYNAYTGNQLIGPLGPSNLSLSSSATIVQTSTQTLVLTSSVTATGGTISYFGDSNSQTYIMATRIA